MSELSKIKRNAEFCHIFNRSISSQVYFLMNGNAQKLSPIHKQRKRNYLDNIRPISIIPRVAKIFKNIFYDQVYSSLSENKLLTNWRSFVVYIVLSSLFQYYKWVIILTMEMEMYIYVSSP